MTQTVVGVFNELWAAKNAEAQLLQIGFTDSMVDVSPCASENGDRDSGTSYQGRVKRFFKELFGAGRDAEQHSNVAHHSEAIITVHADSPEAAERAADVLDASGAVNVDTAAQQWDDASTGTAAAQNPVQVIEETMQVGKRTVETGGARIHSRIVERAVEQDVRLREEKVTVQRRPVDRVASPADLQSFREGQIEVVEHTEVPVVAKETRVVEEISLAKEQGERTETIRDTVRGTDVQVETLPVNNYKTERR